jgi:hypothetical protein
MTQNGWISVVDKLPEKDGLCLVCVPMADEKYMISTAWYDPTGFGWSLMPEQWIGAITHWQPLPEPPRELEWALA